MIPYKPRRDYRFEYVTDAIEFVERFQCHNCIFRNERLDATMCMEVEAQFILPPEEFAPIPELDDRGSDGVVCVKYRNEILAEQAHEDQGRLI